MSGRTYEGPPLDGTVQHFSERPYGDDDGETVDVVGDGPDEVGAESVENVPIPGGDDAEGEDPGEDDPEPPAVDCQSTWADWQEWSP